MTFIDLIAWVLSGSFFRFAGAVILVVSVGYSLSSGLAVVTQAFAHLLAGVRR